MTPDFDDLWKRLSNWGRWGDDDERGTLNLIDADAVRRGVASVKHGRTMSLAIPLDENGPQIGQVPGRMNPLRTLIRLNSPHSDDTVTMAVQAATHWDALAHVSHDGTIYNGFPAGSITVEEGATRCGIDKAGPIVTRGVLLDVARVRGVDCIENSSPITANDLDGAAELAKLDVQAGDVVLVRSGQMGLFKGLKRKQYAGACAGLGLSSAEWFHERDVAAVAMDNYTFEVFPSEVDAPLFPLHAIHLVAMGLTQGQNFDLETLSEDCADDGVYSFLLEASPQPFTGGLGSPVNPVVTK